MIEEEKQSNERNIFDDNIEVIKLKSEIDDLKQQNQSNIIENKELEKELNKVIEMNDELKNNNLILRNQIEELKDIISETENSRNYLSTKMQSENAESTELRKLVLKLKEEKE